MTDCGIMHCVWKGYLWDERSSKALDTGCVAVRRIRCRRTPVRLRDDTPLPQPRASRALQGSRDSSPARRLPWLPWLHERGHERLHLLHLRMGTITQRSHLHWVASRTVVYAISGTNHSRVRRRHPLSSGFSVRCHADSLALEMDVGYTFYCDSFCCADHACGRVVPSATPLVVEGHIRLLCDLLASGTHGSEHGWAVAHHTLPASLPRDRVYQTGKTLCK